MYFILKNYYILYYEEKSQILNYIIYLIDLVIRLYYFFNS